MGKICKPTIIFAGGVAFISFVIVYSAPLNELWKGLAALPGIFALAASLFQVFRDDIAHHRKQQLQSEQQLFNLGATSHMANTVFDKHVEFCEAYLTEVDAMLETCFREGPHPDVLKHVSELFRIRRKFTAWIPEEMAAKLEPYEKIARELGASADAAQRLSNHDPQAQRTKFVEKTFKKFGELLGVDGGGDKEAAITSLKREVREILQVNGLVAVRDYLIRRAVASTEDNP